ncbi:MAG: phenylalanine--tRNA ligase subunit beta [Candidatus Atribacteria bacterium]|nr:phenylalanine--tRNA ligase subunit beta [Candidatus Atribacteria bacterium]
MQVSYNLLKEYIDIELSPTELADRLSMNGIVAEHSKGIFEDVSGVVVGKIKEIYPHQQNDNLSVCLVDLKSDLLEIVCGAKNMKVGDCIPLALDGAILPELGKIETKNFQGVYSKGMICSASELGLEKSKSPGVLIFSQNIPLGEDIKNVKGIRGDVIFDFEIFSNRPDLMSVIGIAREIAAFSKKPLRIPEINIIEAKENITDNLSVFVKDQELCPRYASRIIKGLQIQESPFWLRWKLFLLGIRPINNVVDATNFVMMETGQPLHAFDLEYIHGRQIIVRRAYEGEKFVSLDSTERKLTKENLVIADTEKAIALAGVMGGENSEIKNHTNDVVLESAYFNSVNIRRTSRYFSLRTDASNRFEKGIDPDGQTYALDRTASLIAQITSGKVLSGIIDERNNQFDARKPIRLHFDKIERIMGVPIKDKRNDLKKQSTQILERLEMKIIKRDDCSLTILPPTFRGDIQRDVDLIEEIAKIYGYEKIPSTLFRSTFVQKGKSFQQKVIDKIKYILIGCGMHQTIGYSMINTDSFDWMNLHDNHPLRNTIKLLNPLIQDQSVMRTTLIPGILKVIQRNTNHKVEKIKIFEIGRVYFPRVVQKENNLPIEKLMLAGAITKIGRGNIWEKTENWNEYDLKGILESLFDSLRIKNVDYVQGEFPAFDIERNVRILLNEQDVGIFGKIHPDITNFLGIPGDIFLFELCFDEIYPLIHQQVIYKPIPKYPFIRRDIAIIIKEPISIKQIETLILKIDKKVIQEVELFDIFRGKQIEPGYKSVAFSIVFQADDRTLTDLEVDKIIENVKMKLKENFNAELRQ